MVSYRQLDQHGIKQVVLHERETGSSGRPKPTHGIEEDANYFYTYTRTGGVEKTAKTPLDKYVSWHRDNVKFAGGKRITPLTEFEKQMGVKLSIPTYSYHGVSYTDEQWHQFRWSEDDRFLASNPKIPIDWGAVQIGYETDLPSPTGYLRWQNYFKKKATEKGLITVSIANLHFKEKDDPAVVEKIPPPARPNPKEESIASVKIEKPEPVEPIKEVEKYSPLMIAGVIAVVVILLLKKRRA